MALILLLALTLFVVATAAFTQRLRRTALWAGRVIPDPMILSQMPRGMQDAITPPALTFLTIAIPVARVLIVVIGTAFVAWYAGIAALIASAILSGLFGQLLPKTLPFYLQILLRDMHRRNADYARDGDTQRALASQQMISGLSWLVSSAGTLPVPVPTTLQVMRATKDALFE